MADRILYFAYGHNTNIPELKKRVPDAKRIGRAIAPNYQLVMRHYTDIMAKDGGKTYGVLWAMSTEGVQELNYFEGDNRDYSHAYIEVLYKGKLYKALTFVMIPRKDKGREPSEKYIKHVYDGYKMNQIPIDQLSSAVRSRAARISRDKKDIY
jgi:Gamma-glutamyl cyclotransferase, AIG2-like